MVMKTAGKFYFWGSSSWEAQPEEIYRAWVPPVLLFPVRFVGLGQLTEDLKTQAER